MFVHLLYSCATHTLNLQPFYSPCVGKLISLTLSLHIITNASLAHRMHRAHIKIHAIHIIYSYITYVYWNAFAGSLCVYASLSSRLVLILISTPGLAIAVARSCTKHTYVESFKKAKKKKKLYKYKFMGRRIEMRKSTNHCARLVRWHERDKQILITISILAKVPWKIISLPFEMKFWSWKKWNIPEVSETFYKKFFFQIYFSAV